MSDLYARICSFKNLELAAHKALLGKKGKKNACEFYFNLEKEIFFLQEELTFSTYIPRPLNNFKIFEPKERIISCSNIRDRVVHHAVFNVIAQLFEMRFIDHSYACRVGKGTHRAIRQAQMFSKDNCFFLKCDIAKFFATISHSVLKGILELLVPCSKTKHLLGTIIDHGSETGIGLPIGSLSSQYFANLYLGELDLYVKNELNVKAYLRYMDDFIFFADAKSQAQDLLRCVEQYLCENLLLSLNQRALQIAPTTVGLSFLGFRVYPKLIRIKRENLIRLRKKMMRCMKDIKDEKNLQATHSMMSHIRQANTHSLRVKEFVKT